MKLATIKLVFDRKKVADNYKLQKKSKKGLLQLEIYYNGQRKYMSTGIKLYDGQWHPLKGIVNHPDSVNLNAIVQKIVKTANENIKEQYERNKTFSFSVLQDALDPTNQTKNLHNFIDMIIEQDLKIGRSKNTAITYGALRYNLDKFGKIIQTSDITKENIITFRNWLIGRGIKTNSIYTYMAKFQRIVTELITRKMMVENPFEQVTIDKQKSATIKYLTVDEVEKIKAFEPKSKPQQYAKDFFLFQCYTGMSYADVVALKREDVIDNGKNKIIRNKRIKTGIQFTIVLLPEAIEILERYDYALNTMLITSLDRLLHIIGKDVLGRNISSHQGRHTFATWALSRKVPLEYVAHMLGHSGIVMTQKYAKILQEDVIKEFDKLQ